MMCRIIKKFITICSSLIGFIFLFISDDFLVEFKVFSSDKKFLIVLINKFIILFLVCIIVFIFEIIYYKTKKKINIILDKNYKIEIKYGDILKNNDGIKVINFDECFTTKIGECSGDIKKSSLCGNYLTANPEINEAKIEELLKENDIKSKTKVNI